MEMIQSSSPPYTIRGPTLILEVICRVTKEMFVATAKKTYREARQSSPNNDGDDTIGGHLSILGTVEHAALSTTTQRNNAFQHVQQQSIPYIATPVAGSAWTLSRLAVRPI